MSPPTLTQRTGLEQPSPLAIPELLDRVFSYLDQRTLSYNCTRVARLWSETARRYVEPEYAWSDCLQDSEDLERALTMLPWITRLQWFSGSVREAASEDSQRLHRALLLNALETVEYNRETPRRAYDQDGKQLYDQLKSLLPPSTTGQQQIALPGRLRAGPRVQLRTLELCGDLMSTWSRLLLPLLSTLTRLKISTAFGKATTTPMSGEYITIHDIHQDCPLLEELHIMAGRNEWLFGPRTRVFYTEELQVQHMQLLEHQPNNITFLELCGSVSSEHLVQGRLHHYLCASPHLLHLKALAFPFHIEHMDLHGLLPPVTDRYHPAYLPGVWKCRKLRTLHVRIATPRNDAGLRPPPMPEHSRIAFGYIARVCPELQEIEFANGGYGAEDPYLNLTLLGGLCLLGRLQHLERFSSGTWKKRGVLNARNLEWIVESGRTEPKKAKRQKELRSVWKKLGLLDFDEPVQDTAAVTRQEPESITSAGLKKLASLNTKKRGRLEPKARFDWAGIDATLREELKYLGLPVEVKTFFNGLDKPGKDGGGNHCFPVLRYLSFCSPGGIELSPEREIKRLTINKSRRPWVKP
ncbi:hypothetical protein F5H01DRAFT_360782 [Linnemannia elongata]|nr:hypothetical protein F5H01DRAFT_360782 [Linnemannia elongata]